MSSAYGKIVRNVQSTDLTGILPLHRLTRTSTAVTLDKVDAGNSALVSHLQELFNAEIRGGSTYPQEEELDAQGFRDYFLGYDAFVLTRDDISTSDIKARVLGMFYVKPNYPGRCSHICNGGFFTSPASRDQGAGIIMAKAFLQIAPALGYQASVFNLVFENNAASVKIWRSLGFKEVGRIPKAGRLRNSPHKLVDAIIFYYDFSTLPESSTLETNRAVSHEMKKDQDSIVV